MELWPQISRQRVRHIVESYCLAGPAAGATEPEQPEIDTLETKPSIVEPQIAEAEAAEAEALEARAPEARAMEPSVVGSPVVGASGREPFWSELDELLQHYPAAALELALVEILTETWAMVPLPRGTLFLGRVRDRLQAWKATQIEIRVTPSQFQQITGLDPEPVFSAMGPSTPASLNPLS